MGFLSGMGDREMTQVQVTDAVCSPPSSAMLHSERFVWLPDSFHPTSLPIRLNIQQRAQPVQPNTVILTALTQLFKVEPSIFNVWTNALKLLRGRAALVMFRSGIKGNWAQGDNSMVTRNIHLEMEARGLSTMPKSSMLLFADLLAPESHLDRLETVSDLCLDTPMLHGGRTTLDCLTAGVPIVTLLGLSLNQRLGASLLGAMRIHDHSRVQSFRSNSERHAQLTTQTHTEYEDTLVTLINNRLHK